MSAAAYGTSPCIEAGEAGWFPALYRYVDGVEEGPEPTVFVSHEMRRALGKPSNRTSRRPRAS